MTDRRFDVVVVGGGINGSGVAQAAAAAGHSVLLLEKSSLGEGTSSRSSKLIHGGLRYLESYEFSMVRESLAERALLLRNAPDLVRLVDFHIPVYRETRRPPWLVRLGLSLYAVLGGLSAETRFQTVPRSSWDTLDGLQTNNLLKVFKYRDAQTDDRALTKAVMSSAVSLGAELACPAEFVAAEITENAVAVTYEISGQQQSCQARVLVNAAGPWVNQVADRLGSGMPQQEIELVQGSHIELNGSLQRGIYYMESRRDGRAVFVMPWRDRIAVGTTETRFKGDPDHVVPLRSEKRYLLEVFRNHFPAYRNAHIEAAWAGLRVLPAGKGHAFHRSRETILVTDRPDKPRVLSIYGGKLTTYRSTALKVLKQLEGSLPPGTARADTADLPLKPPP